MSFLIEPVTDLIVPLCRIANQRDREETEKFFQATFRTGLAAAVFFLHVIADKVIAKTTEPQSMPNLSGSLVVLTIIFFATASVHPYVAILSETANISYRSAKSQHFNLAPLQIVAIAFGLYLASKVKHCLSEYKLDQQITLLSKNLADYFTTKKRL
ncbi:MAG: hypothetical protein JSS10_05565 [Verrucomicrobia bacterium]|nr:hypothetical protein [Verrucomicrobiota bacterium]